MIDLADLYARVAIQGVSRIRAEDPEEVHRWLCNAMLDVREQANADGVYVTVEESYVALASVLFAAVPEDRTWGELTAWVTDEPVDSVERRRRQWRESQRRRRAA